MEEKQKHHVEYVDRLQMLLTIQTWKARVLINLSIIHPFNIVVKLSKVSLVLGQPQSVAAIS